MAASPVLTMLLCTAAISWSLADAASCKGVNGTFAISGSCDAYIECVNGEAHERLCPDGLLYNAHSAGYPCSYPIDVECEQRASLQAAQPTKECPHQFGFHRMGDASHCGQFMNCVNGRGFVLDCPKHLAWNKETYRCDWPDQVQDCDAEAYLGFRCPDPARKSDLLGEVEAEYEFHESPQNCQEYFICIGGRPRAIDCGGDQAFNAATKSCDDIENVSSCSADARQRALAYKAARQAEYDERKAASNARGGHKL